MLHVNGANSDCVKYLFMIWNMGLVKKQGWTVPLLEAVRKQIPCLPTGFMLTCTAR